LELNLKRKLLSILKGHVAMKTLNKPAIIILAVTLTAFNLTLNGCAQQKIQRYGSVIGLKSEKIEEYKRLHADVWPGVLKMIKQCNIRNYSIYLGELENDKYYLFSYFEYTGDDFKADMAKMAADPTTQKWWSFCEPCQSPIPTRKEGEWWANMEEVFHYD
jgi:L-rhamnose mutarotase